MTCSVLNDNNCNPVPVIWLPNCAFLYLSLSDLQTREKCPVLVLMSSILLAEDVMSRGGSVSPPVSPDLSPGERRSSGLEVERENKFSSLQLSPTKLPDQKPFRGFDITSLIRKDDEKNG